VNNDQAVNDFLSMGTDMKHYRVNKLAERNGPVVKSRDILARDDKDAVRTAREDEDCPVCEVLHAGKKVGSID
jgi:hypothetical protein